MAGCRQINSGNYSSVVGEVTQASALSNSNCHVVADSCKAGDSDSRARYNTLVRRACRFFISCFPRRHPTELIIARPALRIGYSYTPVLSTWTKRV